MRYPVAIHHDKNSAYGVTVPDIPGCFSAGNTFDEALNNTVEAITAHLSLLAEGGQVAPMATHVEDHFRNTDFRGATWGFVDIDTISYSGKTEKINVTLPSIISRKIEEAVHKGIAKNRSAFLAEAAIEKLARI